MISRLAMRENTAVLAEVVALALLLWGLRRNHPLATFLGGVVAGLGFYVYYPARATFADLDRVPRRCWASIGRRRFPARRILTLGAIAVAGFVLVATPIMIAESHIPRSSASRATPTRQHSTYLIYPEARERERDWVHASSVAEGVKTNIRWGLGAFNNKITDNGIIYVNPGHGFVDPLTGILLWLGVGLVGFRLVRRELDEGELLAAVRLRHPLARRSRSSSTRRRTTRACWSRCRSSRTSSPSRFAGSPVAGARFAPDRLS